MKDPVSEDLFKSVIVRITNTPQMTFFRACPCVWGGGGSEHEQKSKMGRHEK